MTLIKYQDGPLNQQPQQPQQQQQQQKQQWEKLIDLVHFNDNDKSYKTLQVLRTDQGNIVLQLSEGVAQQSRSRILFQLNEQELAYLCIKLQKLL